MKRNQIIIQRSPDTHSYGIYASLSTRVVRPLRLNVIGEFSGNKTVLLVNMHKHMNTFAFLRGFYFTTKKGVSYSVSHPRPQGDFFYS